MWGVLVNAVIGALSFFLPRLLIGFGVFGVTNALLGSIITDMYSLVLTKLGEEPYRLVALTQYIGVWDFMKIWFAAYTAAVAMRTAKMAVQAAAVSNQKTKL